jgi:hypothetical protein
VEQLHIQFVVLDDKDFFGWHPHIHIKALLP